MMADGAPFFLILFFLYHTAHQNFSKGAWKTWVSQQERFKSSHHLAIFVDVTLRYICRHNAGQMLLMFSIKKVYKYFTLSSFILHPSPTPWKRGVEDVANHGFTHLKEKLKMYLIACKQVFHLGYSKRWWHGSALEQCAFKGLGWARERKACNGLCAIWISTFRLWM